MIDVSDIELIRLIVKEGSVNKASEILHISQPTLSKRISRLEQLLNLSLFDRQKSGMVPTAVAKYLMDSGEGLKDQLNSIQRQLELMASMKGGVVKLGVGPYTEQMLLPRVLLDFAEKKYAFNISVVTDSLDNLLKKLAASEIDLAIGPFGSADLNDQYQVPLQLEEKIIGVVRAGHKLTQLDAEQITPEALVSHAWVLPNIPRQYGEALGKFVQFSDLSANISCNDCTTIKSIVLNSDYISAGPASLFRKELSSGELVECSLPIDLYWKGYCAVKPEVALMPAIKEVIQLFAQYMQPNPEGEVPT